MAEPQAIEATGALGAVRLKLTVRGADRLPPEKREEIETFLNECVAAIL